jgi:hypothetical protein
MAPRALTISAEWGVSAAPERPEPLGRAGPWAWESAAVERAYGAGSVLHLSLEEFARTLTSAEESFERFREGGVPVRAIPARLASASGREDLARFRAAYRRFRGFDRPNLLSVFATFRPSTAFAREYPEAVQTGPLWPGRARARPHTPRARVEWLWYASPASAAGMVGPIDRALAQLPHPPRVSVRSPRPLPLPSDGDRWVALGPEPPDGWATRFGDADLRIVTGSRTLLEALEVGGPFLYYNGVVGQGRSRRRHRPEKVVALLEAWRADGVGRTVARDLRDFAGGRAIGRIARRAACDPEFAVGFPDGWRPRGFRPPFDDAGRFLLDVAGRWAEGVEEAAPFTAAVRARGRAAFRSSRSSFEV